MQRSKRIESKTDAWLTFLSSDEPERIIELIETYPEFKEMYHNIYELCLNTERVMDMFSKELMELDRNTVNYMIDELQNELDEKNEIIKEKDEVIKQLQSQLESNH